MPERLTGFDARVTVEVAAHCWDAARRRTYLLRDDVDTPLSVDPLVWPSFFDLGHGIGFSSEERSRLGLAGQLGANSTLPDWIGSDRPLWEHLGALRTHLREQGVGLPAGILIAIARFSPDETSPTSAIRWQRLGYDVADGSLTSGLSNCGYGEQGVQALRASWSQHLNHHHLFDDTGAALDFCTLADNRVPEHAPFYVYGLYNVEALP